VVIRKRGAFASMGGRMKAWARKITSDCDFGTIQIVSLDSPGGAIEPQTLDPSSAKNVSTPY
jgi:hypothetical protein